MDTFIQQEGNDTKPIYAQVNGEMLAYAQAIATHLYAHPEEKLYLRNMQIQSVSIQLDPLSNPFVQLLFEDNFPVRAMCEEVYTLYYQITQYRAARVQLMYLERMRTYGNF
jgi:hypothetical protein